MEVSEALIPSGNQNHFLLKLFHSHVQPGKRAYRQHHHTEFEIAVFKEGCGTYTVGSKLYDIRPGDVFLFSTHEIHCITEIADCKQMVLMNIHFEPRFIWSPGNDLFDAKYLKIFFDRNENFENRLDRNNPATQKIRSLMLQMEQEFHDKLSEYELMIKIQLMTILVTLIRNYDYVNETGSGFPVTQQSLAKIEEAMLFIDQNVEKDLSLEEIAKAAGMSRTYFSTIFKKLNGISPWDYITAKRIEKSIERLKDGNETVLEIACACGFNNTANFNRAFRKITGKVPTDYR